MKIAAFLIAALIATLTSLVLIIALLSTPGVKASTTYSPAAGHALIAITLGSRLTCEEGDWAFCLRTGYVGRVRKLLGDMAMCETYVEIRPTALGSVFRIF